MNKNQEQAIEQIEVGMRLAAKAGLAFAGVDTNLVCFPVKEFRRVSKQNNNGSPGEVLNEITYTSIECNYIDSCAT